MLGTIVLVQGMRSADEYRYCVNGSREMRTLILLHPLKNKTDTAFSE